ncbi:unnamed protein product [Vitrella brassicaformis CCMP3155]|uniref:Carrier domain-containing protein n=2 Tax=Vitrella brassicaformis TaxID=1169539 RepID=A0A0G4F6S1_VITBC|nr:unnamed protein product [Vitrella brassicaformis CCMP3155]|eukprot:CEM08117.1 unnamed protein product [Vitrella brassicaformis CCMP3155]
MPEDVAHLLPTSGEPPLLHEIFERSAAAHPDNVAVECEEDDIRWTYAELEETANVLARIIRSCHVLPDDLCGVFLPRGAHFYLCMLSILKAGGAYVSIDPEYPPERVQSTLEDGKAKLVLTSDDLVPVVEAMGGVVPPDLVTDLSMLTSWAAEGVEPGATIVLTATKWGSLMDSEMISALPLSPSEVGVEPRHACYAIFTSGSTGRPKGVCIEHRCASNFVLAEQMSFPTTSEDRVLQGFSTSFDASVEEIWLAFAAGATLVVGTKETMRQGPALGAVLAKKGITVFSTVPTVLRLVEDIPAPPLLRIVITGGEACPPEVVDKWDAPGRQLLNTYGPTEATVVATYDTLTSGKPVTIGKPLPGYSCYIVDEQGALCPPGKPGELLIGGMSVARGYINRPDLNPEKFIPDKYSPPMPNWLQLAGNIGKASSKGNSNDDITTRAPETPRAEAEETWVEVDGMSVNTDVMSKVAVSPTYSGRVRPELIRREEGPFGYVPRLYRTGDLVQWSPNHDIEFLGRIDSQVKIRGFRVELSEIESALGRHPPVANVCVIVRQDIGKGGAKTLVAYLEPKKEDSPDTDPSTLTPDALRAHAASILPDYMVPARYVLLDAIPISPTGKVDRKALEKMPTPGSETAPGSGAGGGPGNEYLEPEGVLETTLAELFSDVLNVERVGAEDDFFQLGGNSLSAAQFISALRKKIRMVPTAVRDLYDARTVRKLATNITDTCRAEGVPLRLPRARVFTHTPPQTPLGRLATRFATGLKSIKSRLQTQTESGGAPALTRWTVWFLQGVFLLFLSAFAALWVAAGLWAIEETLDQYSVTYVIFTFPAWTIVSWAVWVLVSVAVKWIVLGKVVPGEHPLWGWYFLRWWIVETWGAPLAMFSGTPVLSWVLRLYGVKVGRNVHIASTLVSGYDLLTLDDDVVINVGARVSCWEVEDGKLRLGTVKLGRGAVLGQRSGVNLNTEIGDGGSIGNLAVLHSGQKVPASAHWEGAPARGSNRVAIPTKSSVKKTHDDSNAANVRTPKRHLTIAIDVEDDRVEHRRVGAATLAMFCFGVLLGYYVIFLALGVPLMAWLWATTEAVRVSTNEGFSVGAAWAPVLVVGGLLWYLLFTVVLKWVTVQRIKEGAYPLYGWLYLRWWVNHWAQQITLTFAHQFYSTMFTRTYFNLLGAKLGRRVEISDARHWTPDMLHIGDDCFVADFVGLGGWTVDAKRNFCISKVMCEERTFLGNNACVPGGSRFGKETLLGVMSLAPGADEAKDGTSWLGSLPFPLANRAVVKDSGDSRTFNPPVHLYPIRGSIEALRTILPGIVSVYSFLLAWYVGTITLTDLGWWGLFLMPAMFWLYGSVNAIVAIAGKWLLVGRYGEQQAPLWSSFVWRAELSNALEEDLAFNSFIRVLIGTPLLPMWFHLLGARIGSRVYMATPHLTEPDLVAIGDDACINDDVTVQGHLFEDRIMKMGTITIGRRCTVGTRAVVLYTTNMADGSYLAPMSLMMKGEEFERGERFGGIPAKPILFPTHRMRPQGSTSSVLMPYTPLTSHAVSVQTVQLSLKNQMARQLTRQGSTLSHP